VAALTQNVSLFEPIRPAPPITTILIALLRRPSEAGHRLAAQNETQGSLSERPTGNKERNIPGSRATQAGDCRV
jgi:hypothetical protein